MLTLLNGLELHIAEYVVTEPVLTRPKYRYHLQTGDGRLMSRWDNAPHHADIDTWPDHRHDDRGQAHPSAPVSVLDVLDAVWPLL